jgi:hypothetical protein
VWVIYEVASGRRENATDRSAAHDQGIRRDEVQRHKMIDGIDCVPCSVDAGDRSTHRVCALSPCRDAGGCETA